MALTIASKRQGVDVYGKRFVEADVTFDSSYPTGGETLPLADIGLTVVDRIEQTYVIMPDDAPFGVSTSMTTSGSQVVPTFADRSSVKLKVYTSSDTEAGNATDQSGVTVRLRFIGR